jgi:hypothetical protein
LWYFSSTHHTFLDYIRIIIFWYFL